MLWHSVIRVAGQTADNPWTTPVNLSLSGSASKPQIISDSEGLMHVIWQDSIDDYIYVQRDSDTWSEPQPVELPFGTRRFYPDLDEDEPTPLFTPHLAVDEDGLLHAVWIDDVGDLYHSSVEFEDFTDYTGWTARKKIASSVLTVSLDVGPDGRLHVAYLQTAEDDELQPGIFYTQSDNGETWLEPVSLFTSIYYRLMEAESANVHLAVANENRIFVAWDDWPNERVLTIRSLDSGVTWDEPNEVDKRQEDDDATAVGPTNIQIAANNDIIHVIWQAGHNSLCNPYYQWSTDGGENWQPAQQIWDEPADCPTEIHFEESGSSYLIRASTTIGSLLVPWNRTAWGAPQLQPALDTMKDPETFKPITYICGQDSISLEAQLWLVACGEGESSQDIWALSRPLTLDVQDASLWTDPTTLAKTIAPIVAPIIVADDTNRFHAFWGRVDTGSSPSQGHQTVDLQYARWEEGQWSTPKKILGPASGGDNDLSVIVDKSRRLLAVWSGAEQGEIYFSRVVSGLALLSSEWSEPKLLSSPDSIGSSPKIAIDNNGVIYVVYAIPVNEERGIYLVKSTDNGNTWTEPSLIFDLNTPEWGLIDALNLAIAGDGQLHLLWLNEPYTGPSGTSLYYAYSHDGGESWSQATVIAPNNQKDATVLWNQIIGEERGIVHRVWQEWALGQISLWHQISIDDGRSWSQPIRILGLNVSKLPTTLMMDRTGQLHLIYFDEGSPETGEGVFSLRHWVWRGDQWRREEALALNKRPNLDVDYVAAVIGPDSQLAALYSGPVQAEEGILHSLYFSDRTFDLPEANITPQPLPTVAPTATVEPSPTAELEPSPTPIPTLSPSETTVGPIVEQQGPLDGILPGLAAAAVPVGLLFAVFILRQNRIKNR